jgi:alkylhydroperoxidase family enzyme
LVRNGLTEAQVEAATGEVADLPGAPSPAPLGPEIVAALKLVDVLTEYGTPEVGPELMAELLEHYDHGQILELGYALAVASGWQRMIEAFGIRPDYWTGATPAPRRPGS